MAILVERAGGRIECGLGGDDVAVFIEWHFAESEGMDFILLLYCHAVIFKVNAGAGATLHEREDRVAQLRSGHVRGFSGYEGLT